jgi:hypothetical protein
VCGGRRDTRTGPREVAAASRSAGRSLSRARPRGEKGSEGRLEEAYVHAWRRRVVVAFCFCCLLALLTADGRQRPAE